MEARALLDRRWNVIGLAEGWRRSTGVLRAELLERPLFCWVHPADLERLWLAGELADFLPQAIELRIGLPGRRQAVRFALDPWGGSLTTVSVERRGGLLPRAEWFQPFEDGLPAIPAVVRC